MLSLLRFSLRHPRRIVALVLLLTALSWVAIPRVHLELDARSLIPRDHPAMAASDRAAALFGVRDVVLLALENPRDGIYHPSSLALLRTLSAELEREPGVIVDSVASLATVPRLVVENDTIDLRPLLHRDLPVNARMAHRIAAETRAAGLDDGVLVAPDGRAATLLAEVDPTVDRQAIAERIEALLARHAGGCCRLYASGTVMAQADLGASAGRDLLHLVPLVIVILGAVMMLIFRHPVPALVSLGEVGISLLWTVGLLGLYGEGIFVTTLVLPVVLIVIGVTDDVYALTRFFTARHRAPDRPVAELIYETFSVVSPAIQATAATTIFGLLSIALIHLAPQRVFGVCGALSVLFSTLFTFTLLPALLVLLDPHPKPVEAPFARFAQAALSRWLGVLRRTSRTKVLAPVAAVALVAVALIATRLRIEDNWVGNLPPSSATAQGDRAINRLLAGTNTVDVLFDSGRPQGFLEPGNFAALANVEAAIAADPKVGAVESLAGDVLRVDAALAGVAGVDFRAHRERLRRGPPLAAARIEQAVALLDSARRPPATVHLDREGRRARMTVFVRAANYSRVAAVLRTIRQAARASFGAAVPPVPFGDGWISYLTVQLLVVGQARSIATAVLWDLLVLLLIFRSLPTALLALAPVAVSILLVFATLAATGTPLGTANSMFASIALSVGVDYSIHLVTLLRRGVAAGAPRDEALASAVYGSGPAILTSVFAIVAGFAVLIFSTVPPNRQLGLLVCFTMTLCAFITLLLLPTIVLDREVRP
jgi:uncharacterized protein